jgi:hypothetical protein
MITNAPSSKAFRLARVPVERARRDQEARGVHAAGFGQIDLRINLVPAPRDGRRTWPLPSGGLAHHRTRREMGPQGIRNLVAQHSVTLGTSLSGDSHAAGRWELENGGEYFAAGRPRISRRGACSAQRARHNSSLHTIPLPIHRPRRPRCEEVLAVCPIRRASRRLLRARAHSMKSCAAGLMVRSFKETIPTFRCGIGKSTGRALTDRRFPLKRIVEAARRVRKRSVG